MKVSNESDGTTVHFHGTNGVHPLDYEEGFNRAFYHSGDDGNNNTSGSLESSCKRCGGAYKQHGCREDRCKRMIIPPTYNIYDPNAPICLDMLKYQKWCKCLAYVRVPNCFEGKEVETIESVIKCVMRNISIVPYGMDRVVQGHWVFNEYPQIEACKTKNSKEIIIYAMAPPSANQITNYVNLMKGQYRNSKDRVVSFCLDDLYSSDEYKAMKTGSYENACSILLEVVKELKLEVRTQRRLMRNEYCVGNENIEEQIYGSKLQPHDIMVVPCNHQHINTYCRMNERIASKGHDVIGGDFNHVDQNTGYDSCSKLDSRNDKSTKVSSFLEEFNKIQQHRQGDDDDKKTVDVNVSGNHHINQLSQFVISALHDGLSQVDFIKENIQHNHAKQMMSMLHDNLVSLEDFKKTTIPTQKKDVLNSTKSQNTPDKVISELNEFLEKLNTLYQSDEKDKYNELALQIKSNIMNDIQKSSGKHIDAFLNGAKKNLENQEAMFSFNHYDDEKNSGGGGGGGNSTSLFEHLMGNFSKTLETNIGSKSDAQKMIDKNGEILKKNIMKNASSIGCYSAPPNEDLFSSFKGHGRNVAFAKGNHSSKNVITYNNHCVLLREIPDDANEYKEWNEKASDLEKIDELNDMIKKEKFSYEDPDMHQYKKGTESNNVVVFYKPDGKKEYLCLLRIDPEGQEDWKRKWKKGRPPAVSFEMSKPEMSKLKNMGVVYEKYEPLTKLSNNFMKSYNLCGLVDSMTDYNRKTKGIESPNQEYSSEENQQCSFEFKNKNIGGDRLKLLLKQNK